MDGRSFSLSSVISLTALLAPAAACAADSQPGPGAGQLIQLIVGLVVVIAAVVIFGRILPRFTGQRLSGGANLRVVSSLVVGQKDRLVLLQLGERQLLLGVTPGRITTLHVLDEPLPLDDTPTGSAAAPGWLTRMLAERR